VCDQAIASFSSSWYPSVQALKDIGKKVISSNSEGLVAVEYWAGSWITNLTFFFMNNKVVVRSPPAHTYALVGKEGT